MTTLIPWQPQTLSWFCSICELECHYPSMLQRHMRSIKTLQAHRGMQPAKNETKVLGGMSCLFYLITFPTSNIQLLLQATSCNSELPLAVAAPSHSDFSDWFDPDEERDQVGGSVQN